jgi:hypothetical protein
MYNTNARRARLMPAPAAGYPAAAPALTRIRA